MENLLALKGLKMQWHETSYAVCNTVSYGELLGGRGGGVAYTKNYKLKTKFFKDQLF